LDLDGLDDAIDVPHNPGLSITDTITLAAWLQASSDKWKYKKMISLAPVTPEDDYQVMVALTNANFDYSHAQAAGQDVRFFDDNYNLLSYWIEKWNDTGNSTIWVKVPTSGTALIYMYYGNSTAPAGGDGLNTFEFFDDFNDGNDDGWTVHNGTWSVAANAYYQSGNLTTYVRTSTGNMAWPDYIIETRIYICAGGATGGFAGVLFRFQDIDNHYAVILDDRPDDSFYIRGWVGGAYNVFIEDASITIDRDTWYDLRISIADGGTGNATIKVWIDGLFKNQIIDTPQNWAAGKIALMMHGTQAYYDDIRVRKYAAAEPVATINNEIAAAIGKSAGYSLNADTSDAFARINDQELTGAIGGGWQHVVLTYDKDAGGIDELKLFINGTQVDSADYANLINGGTEQLRIGDMFGFNGLCDEVRISRIVRSPDWITAAYNNQNAPNAFCSFSPEYKSRGTAVKGG
ncbi:DUF2341 domain-containing protein, partial [Planctomycetota bacterium]